MSEQAIGPQVGDRLWWIRYNREVATGVIRVTLKPGGRDSELQFCVETGCELTVVKPQSEPTHDTLAGAITALIAIKQKQTSEVLSEVCRLASELTEPKKGNP